MNGVDLLRLAVAHGANSHGALVVGAKSHETLILGARVGSFGALLVGVGAILLLAQAAGGPAGLTGTTFGGTIALPERRLGSGMEFAGATLVALGSALLLFDNSHLSALAVIATLILAIVLVYLTMAVRLRAHLKVASQHQPSPPPSLLWCLRHPRWRPRPE